MVKRGEQLKASEVWKWFRRGLISFFLPRSDDAFTAPPVLRIVSVRPATAFRGPGWCHWSSDDYAACRASGAVFHKVGFLELCLNTFPWVYFRGAGHEVDSAAVGAWAGHVYQGVPGFFHAQSSVGSTR